MEEVNQDSNIVGNQKTNRSNIVQGRILRFLIVLFVFSIIITGLGYLLKQSLCSGYNNYLKTVTSTGTPHQYSGQPIQCSLAKGAEAVFGMISIYDGFILTVIAGIMAFFYAFRKNKNQETQVSQNKLAVARMLNLVAAILIGSSFICFVLLCIHVFIFRAQQEEFLVLIFAPVILVPALILFLIARYLEKKNKQ